MSYRLKADETLDDGIRRIVRDEVDHAEKMLGKRGGAREEGVHEARKSFKKIRAVLRLVRPSLGATYKDENAWFRDAARELSELRDAQALLESFDQLQAAFARQMKADAFARIRDNLEEHRDTVGEADGDLGRRVKSVRADLKKARARMESWPKMGDGFDVVGPGLIKTFRRGRIAQAQAYKAATDEHFHEWRKRVKYHWYHVRLLQDMWPEVMKGCRASLNELSILLGDDHDLAVMRSKLASFPDDLRASKDYLAFLALIDQRQTDLRARAKLVGARIYSEKPGRLEDRMRNIWCAWRNEQSAPAMKAAEADGQAHQATTYAAIEA